MKVLVEVPISPYSGYGNDGIGLVQALTRAGVDVRLAPSSVQGPLPPEVLHALSKEASAPFDLVIRHESPGVLANSSKELRAASVHGMIGWSMWEWSNFSNLQGRSKLKSGLKNYDALVAYDMNTADCFREHYSGTILTTQGGFNPDQWPVSEARDWDSREFRFAQIGVLTARKNPMATIAAFQDAREQDPEFRRWARMSMKTSTIGLHSKWSDVFKDLDEDGNEYTALRLFYDVWPTSVVKQFYDAAHCLVAPSRGEGKNMPALEAMSTGIPVIATDWGGHQQWLSDDYAYRLNYTLRAEDPTHPKALSAEVDQKHFTDLMLHAFHNRAEVKRKGELASQVIPQLCNWDAVVERLMRQLRATLPEGEQLWAKFQLGARA